jgi:hypothetical protein
LKPEAYATYVRELESNCSKGASKHAGGCFTRVITNGPQASFALSFDRSRIIFRLATLWAWLSNHWGNWMLQQNNSKRPSELILILRRQRSASLRCFTHRRNMLGRSIICDRSWLQIRLSHLIFKPGWHLVRSKLRWGRGRCRTPQTDSSFSRIFRSTLQSRQRVCPSFPVQGGSDKVRASPTARSRRQRGAPVARQGPP